MAYNNVRHRAWSILGLAVAEDTDGMRFHGANIELAGAAGE